jgi:hypothetical protein
MRDGIMRNRRSGEFEGKAAEDSRTPKPRGCKGLRENAPASWSAAVLCRFVVFEASDGCGSRCYPHGARRSPHRFGGSV